MKRFSSLVFLAALAMVACGGGGGGGGGGVVTGGGSSRLDASFTAGNPSPGANSVSLAPESDVDNVVTVRVLVTDTSSVYGAAFDIVYNEFLVDYVDWSAGNLLEQGGHNPNYTVQLAQPGRLVVGISRTGSTAGANAAGSRVLVRLVFRATQQGTSNIQLQNGSLTDNQLPPEDLAGIGWFGGFVTAIEP